MREELLNYQKNYFTDQLKIAQKDPVAGVRFAVKGDRTREYYLLKVLLTHDIPVYRDSKEQGYIVPMIQDRYYTFKAMWDHITSFKDSVFYDVSTWSFPSAFESRAKILNPSRDAFLRESRSHYSPKEQ